MEDHARLRRSLSEIVSLSGSGPVRAFAACEDALEALEQLPKAGAVAGASEPRPGVIVLDIGLPGMSGLEGIRLFKERDPEVEIVIFTVFDDRTKIFGAICAGASGYLLKSEPPERIAAAVEEVRRGGSPMTPEIARLVLERFSSLAAPEPGTGTSRKAGSDSPETVKLEAAAENETLDNGSPAALSEREQEVLRLMVAGLVKKEIADRLGLSVHTVDNYVRRIYRKLHVNTLGGAVARALREGLV